MANIHKVGVLVAIEDEENIRSSSTSHSGPVAVPWPVFYSSPISVTRLMILPEGFIVGPESLNWRNKFVFNLHSPLIQETIIQSLQE